MPQNGAICLSADEFDEMIHHLEEGIVVLNFFRGPIVCQHLSVCFVRSIYVFTPASSLETEHRVGAIKLVPHLFDAVEDYVQCHAKLQIGVGRPNTVPHPHKKILAIYDQICVHFIFLILIRWIHFNMYHWYDQQIFL